jgi:hypothetical protein
MRNDHQSMYVLNTPRNSDEYSNSHGHTQLKWCNGKPKSGAANGAWEELEKW